MGQGTMHGVHIPHGKGNFEGEGAAHCKVQGHSAIICVKTDEPIEMPFGVWARMSSSNHVLDGVQIRHGKEQF